MTPPESDDRRVEDGGASDLRGRAARGGSIVFAVQLVQQGLRIVFLAVLARLLTPEDYGLIGMVLAFTALLATFQDLGLSVATVQRKDLTEAQLSALSRARANGHVSEAEYQRRIAELRRLAAQHGAEAEAAIAN